MDKLDIFYAQFRLFARKMEEGQFPQKSIWIMILMDHSKIWAVWCVLYTVKFLFIGLNKLSFEKVIATFCSTIYFLFESEVIWYNRDLFLKLKLNPRFYKVVVASPKTTRKKDTPTVVDFYQLSDGEKTELKFEISRTFWQFLIVAKKVCVSTVIQTVKTLLRFVA